MIRDLNSASLVLYDTAVVLSRRRRLLQSFDDSTGGELSQIDIARLSTATPLQVLRCLGNSIRRHQVQAEHVMN